MNKKQNTDEKLQTEILEFVNSFPCTYPRDEPTRTTIYNHFVGDKKIDIKTFEHNFNKLRNRYIQYHSSVSNRGEIFFLTPRGESIINPKSKFLRNKNINNKTTIKKISIIGNNTRNIINQGNNSTISTNEIFSKELKKIINKSKLPKPEKKKLTDYIKEGCFQSIIPFIVQTSSKFLDSYL